MRPLSQLPLALVVALVGCQNKSAAPQVSPEQLPKTLIRLESQTEAVLAAFEADDLETADHEMHSMNKLYSTVNRLADQLLDQPQADALQKAVKQHLEAMGELHAPLHESELPEGFDLGSIRERVLAGAEAIRSALPKELVAKLTEAAESRAALLAAPHDTDGEDHGEEHDGHDHDDQSHGDEADGDTQASE